MLWTLTINIDEEDEALFAWGEYDEIAHMSYVDEDETIARLGWILKEVYRTFMEPKADNEG